MTLLEYMQNQLKTRNDFVAEAAFKMQMAIRLFPSLELKEADVKKWREFIYDRYKGNDIREGFEQGVKEFEAN